jgi:t-SNARE complex subunit (syntaxin)
MTRSQGKWLEDLEQDHEQNQSRKQRTHYLWVEPDATDAEVEEECNRRIAQGTAGEGDQFVAFRWRGD